MATRVLAIFPDLDIAGIEQFRGRWDPLAAAVPAHITIAFPFAWPGTARSARRRAAAGARRVRAIPG
ncbi:hypothetical protein ACQP00_17300 [Dactylosporangium sp. CS-047395]|uniref:hypothetical protein n=1 Tax=Dactylosporangium sp. CS-047395 TaxID=3239936 RepID=UPI003D8F4D65